MYVYRNPPLRTPDSVLGTLGAAGWAPSGEAAPVPASVPASGASPAPAQSPYGIGSPTSLSVALGMEPLGAVATPPLTTYVPSPLPAPQPMPVGEGAGQAYQWLKALNDARDEIEGWRARTIELEGHLAAMASRKDAAAQRASELEQLLSLSGAPQLGAGPAPAPPNKSALWPWLIGGGAAVAGLWMWRRQRAKAELEADKPPKVVEPRRLQAPSPQAPAQEVA